MKNSPFSIFCALFLAMCFNAGVAFAGGSSANSSDRSTTRLAGFGTFIVTPKPKRAKRDAKKTKLFLVIAEDIDGSTTNKALRN